MRVICTSDWQLGPAGGRIDPAAGLNQKLIDRYRCARFVVEDGLERGGQLLAIAGDLFDSCGPDPTSVRLCRDALAPALEKHVPIIAITGNHDVAKSSAEMHALDLLRDTPGITILDKPMLLGVWGSEGHLAVEAMPRIQQCKGLTLQLACIPWPNRQLLLAKENYRKLSVPEINALVAEKMLDVIRGLAAQLIEGVPSILMGHFGVDTAEMGGMSRLMMLGGEWTLNLHDLTELGFEAALLGHLHRAQVLWENPFVAYSGSPECIDHGEAADGEKGYYLVHVNDAGERTQ